MNASRIVALLPSLLSTQRSSWEQGIAAQALLEAHIERTSMDPEGYDKTIPNLFTYLYGLVHDAVVRQSADGRLAAVLNGNGTSDPGAVDPACIGEALYYLLHYHSAEINQPRFSAASNGMLDYILMACPRVSLENTNSLTDNLLSHRTDSVQIWSDTVYMLPPFLMSAAVYHFHHPDPRYQPTNLLRMSLRQVILAAQVLQSPTGAWSHIYDLTKRVFERKAFWGVGNSWVCAGIVRIFSTIAETVQSDPEFCDVNLQGEEIKALSQCYDILRRTLNACLQYVRPDNLFHDILDDTSSFVETNLTQQLSYTLYTLYTLLSLHLHTSAEINKYLGLPHLPPGTAEKWLSRAEALREAAVMKTDQ